MSSSNYEGEEWRFNMVILKTLMRRGDTEIMDAFRALFYPERNFFNKKDQ